MFSLAVTQLARYVTDAAEAGAVDALDFWSSRLWSSRRATYSTLLPLTEDLLAAPASQAYVECVFSLCGLLTAGRRNRISHSLQMRAFLKLNSANPDFSFLNSDDDSDDWTVLTINC